MQGHRAGAEQRQLLRPEELARLLPGRLKKLEVEIGCGNGHFMVEYCLLHPWSLFIGVEIKKKRCLKAQRKIENKRLANARVVHGSAEEVLDYLPEESVDSFHLYFPDPWPKSRHRHRRFLRRENVEALQRKLKTGGFIFFVTDFFDYYLHTKILLLLQNGLHLSRRAPCESAFRSVYAQRFSEIGKQIHRLTVRKIGDQLSE